MKWLKKLVKNWIVDDDPYPEWDEFDPRDNPGAGVAICGTCGNKEVRHNHQFKLEPHDCLTEAELEELLSKQTKGEDEQ